MSDGFDYDTAFGRNLGWVTVSEQQALRTRRVAIAGLGGVGGIHLLTLARLGIGAFTLAEFDTFDLANFNRQAGATMDTIGRPKLETMAEMARAINPGLDLRLLTEGVTNDTVDAFLDDADLFIDGFDFFALDIRRRVFARAYERGIPALTAAPIGMGVGFLAFMPGRMTFERYFRLDGQPEGEQYLRFLLGLAPAGLHRSYLADATRIDLGARRGPSTAAGVQLCAGATAATALKILLHRGRVAAAPSHYQFDAYRGRFAIRRLRWGNAGPLQRLRLAAARRYFARPVERIQSQTSTRPIERVIDIARWAPSGDNAQPWRFTIVDDTRAELDFKAGDHGNVYDFRDHEPTTLAAGMLIETLHIAAREFGWRLDWAPLAGSRIAVNLVAATPVADPLFPFITTRSVDRRAYGRRKLRPDEKAALVHALGSTLTVEWHVDLSARRRLGRLAAMATAIRLRTPEAHPVHHQVIDWVGRDSATAIPASAVGVDPITLRLMRWAMRRWGRVRLLNRMMGTGALALQLDHLPAMRSAAGFVLRSTAPALQTWPPVDSAGRLLALLEAGRAVQRFWLTATRLGLVMQPTYATLAFAHYGAYGERFTEQASLLARAARLAVAFRSDLGPTDGVVFMGRIGEPRIRRLVRPGRSVRRPAVELMQQAIPQEPATAPHLP